MPAGLAVSATDINLDLKLRQGGFGRSGRQKIETDAIDITGGVRHGYTTGAPITFQVRNFEHENWLAVMSTTPLTREQLQEEKVKKNLTDKKIERFRPGHADLGGTLKYNLEDIRDVLERASARETAARTAAGSFARILLASLGIETASHVLQIGPVKAEQRNLSLKELEKISLDSPVYCIDEKASADMVEAIKNAIKDGDSLGGVVEVLVDNLPVGLGSYSQWDRRLDGLLAQALLSVPAVKAVELGDGVAAAGLPGSKVHDAMFRSEKDGPLYVERRTNLAGGLEGGMTNGERLIARAYMKPIPTMKKGLDSLSFPGFQPSYAHYERSDACAVPAASVVARAMVSLTLANAILDKFAADSMRELSQSVENYRNHCREITKGK